MDFEQLIKRLEWLDEERRKDKISLATLEEQIKSLEGDLRTANKNKTRAGWIEANRIVRRLAHALSTCKWDQAAGLLREEMAVRRDITSHALIPVAHILIRQAEEAGCGARFAGAGAGGAVWAL